MRYLGDKTRLSGWILGEIGKVVQDHSTIMDPMCGTGAISAGLRASGYNVIAGDLLKVCSDAARVRLEFEEAPKFSEMGVDYEEVLLNLNGLAPKDGFFRREYGAGGSPANGSPPRSYFSDANAGRIDAIRTAIRNWVGDGLISEGEAMLLRYDLVKAAARIANISGTFGYFRKTLDRSSTQPLTLVPTQFTPGYTAGHVVRNTDAVTLVRSFEADAAYFDPPYTWRQYGANYHILETLARDDEPSLAGKSGLRPWRDTHSDFCLKSRIEESLSDLCKESRCRYLFFSYSEDGLLPLESICSILEDHGTVSFKSTSTKRFKSNREGVGGAVTEYLIFLEKTLPEGPSELAPTCCSLSA